MPQQWPVLVGRWLFYGSRGAVLATTTMLLVLTALSVVSPHVYGTVGDADPAGLRLMWSVGEPVKSAPDGPN